MVVSRESCGGIIERGEKMPYNFEFKKVHSAIGFIEIKLVKRTNKRDGAHCGGID